MIPSTIPKSPRDYPEAIPKVARDNPEQIPEAGSGSSRDLGV